VNGVLVAAPLPAVAGLMVLAVLVVTTVGWTLGTRNGLTGLSELVAESWRQVEEELDGRHQLIPRLVETVRPYAVQDGAAVLAVQDARARAVRAAVPPAGTPTGGRAAAEAELTRALDQLFDLADRQPLLVADPDFLALRRELRGSEDRIAAGRRHYNDAARALRARTARLPARLVALGLRVRPAEPFDAPTTPRDTPSTRTATF
jgi:LemA protein